MLFCHRLLKLGILAFLVITPHNPSLKASPPFQDDFPENCPQSLELLQDYPLPENPDITVEIEIDPMDFQENMEGLSPLDNLEIQTTPMIVT